MKKLLLHLLLTFVYLGAADYTSFGQQKNIIGTFTIYTKSRDCEIVKTQTIFGSDHSFKIYSTCNAVNYKQFSSKNAQQGNWKILGDSLVEVSFNKRPSMKFKIISDSLIELQNGSKFNRPLYRRE